MPPAADLIDPSLAHGVSIFACGEKWVLRRRDGAFVAIGGADLGQVGDSDQIGDHPELGPGFARAGFLHQTAEQQATHPQAAPTPRIAGQGALRDAVGPLIEQASPGSGSESMSCCRLLDAPPDVTDPTEPGVVVWPEGALVFISPAVLPQDLRPVTVADVLHRRVAASPLPDLLSGYVRARRRGPVTIGPAAALLVAALVLGQLADGVGARRRLRTVDVDASTWTDRPIFPVPIPLDQRRTW